MTRRKKPEPPGPPPPPRRPAKLDTGRYRKVSVRIWGDERFTSLSPIPPCGQGLFLYLLTAPSTSSIPGLYRASRAQLADELGWSPEAFAEAFREVCSEGLIEYDEKGRLVRIPKAPFHNVPESPNVVRGWRQHWIELPDCFLKVVAWSALRDFTEGLGEAFAKAFAEACPEPSPKTKANQEQEQEQEQDRRKDYPLPLTAPGAGNGGKAAPPEPPPVPVPPPPAVPPPAPAPPAKGARIAPPRISADQALEILARDQPLLNTPEIRDAVVAWAEHRRVSRHPFDAGYWTEQVEWLGNLGGVEIALEALRESKRNRYQGLVSRGRIFHAKPRPRVRDNDFATPADVGAQLDKLFPDDGGSAR